MENLFKQAGYLKGLFHDNMTDEEREKLLGGIVELLDSLTDRVETLGETVSDLSEFVEDIDDDLCALENDDFDDDDDDDGDFCFDADDDDFDDDDDEDEPHGRMVDFKHSAVIGEMAACTECRRAFRINALDRKTAQYVCPHCGEIVRALRVDDMDDEIVEPEKK